MTIRRSPNSALRSRLKGRLSAQKASEGSKDSLRRASSKKSLKKATPKARADNQTVRASRQKGARRGDELRAQVSSKTPGIAPPPRQSPPLIDAGNTRALPQIDGAPPRQSPPLIEPGDRPELPQINGAPPRQSPPLIEPGHRPSIPQIDASAPRPGLAGVTITPSDRQQSAQEAIDVANRANDEAADARGELRQDRGSLLEQTGDKLGRIFGRDPSEEDTTRRSALEERADTLGEKSFEADGRAYDALNETFEAKQQAGTLPEGRDPFGKPRPFPESIDNLSRAEWEELAGTEVPERIRDFPARAFERTEAGMQQKDVEQAAQAIESAVDDIDPGDSKSARNRATLDATETIDEILADAPPEQRGAILEQAQGALDDLAPNLVDLNPEETEQAVANLSSAAEHAGPENVHLLTEPIAKDIANDELKESGSRGGRHNHRSEQEFSDAVHDNVATSGNDLFARSLVDQLDKQGDAEFGAAIAERGSVPGKNALERARDTADRAVEIARDPIGTAKSVADFVGDLEGEVVGSVIGKAVDATGVEDRVAELDSPGDSFTLGIGIEGGGVDIAGAAEAELQVTRDEEGYTLTVSGEASAGVFAAIGANQAGEAEAEGNVVAGVEVEAHFDTLEEAQEAARSITGAGIALAGTSLPGGAALNRYAHSELADFNTNVTATRLTLGVEASANAQLAEAAGHAGAAGGAAVTASSSATIEYVPGEPPALLVTSELEGEANLSIGTGRDIGIPGGGALEVGSLGAEGTITLETRIPLGEDFSELDAIRDPVGTLVGLQDEVAQSETTVSASVVVSGDAAAGVELPGGVTVGAEGAGSAISVELSATIPTAELRDAGGKLFEGDFRGAVDALSDNAELDIHVAVLDRRGIDLDVGVKGGAFKVGAQVEYQVEDQTEVYDFEGSPDELLDEASDFFEDITAPWFE